MDIARQSAWRSETEDSPNCSGQFAIQYSGRGENDSQAGSGPIPQIFPTRDSATNTGLSTSVTQRVFEKPFWGSTGDPPVPSGDSPDGTAATVRAHGDGLFPAWLTGVPVGGSPTVAGEPPALPISKTRSETTDAIGNQDGLIRLCGGAKAGSISPADWIEEIKRVWARGPASTLELSRVMCAVRDLLPRGGWTTLWKSGDMPFARRKAYYLLGIGDGMGWATAQTFAHLPTGWTILYQLAKLGRRTLERLIQEGMIHPALKLWEARKLVTQLRGETLKTRSVRAVLRERLRRLAEYFAANLADLNEEDMDLAEAQLTRIIEQIGARKLLARAPRTPAS